METSVIMAVYNGQKTVEEAIKSILRQIYKNFEFIIVDDGSNDKTFEILKKYSENYDYIRIIKNSKNIGLTKSLNAAIAQSKGIFIARQDDDDVSLPSRLEKQIKFLKDNPDYGFCGSNGIIKQNGKDLLKVFELNEIKKRLIVKNCFSHPSIVIRKELLEKYGYYDDSYLYGQDYELWCRLIYKYQIKSENLRDKLIIMNIPMLRFIERRNLKFLTQQKNLIKTKLKYINYSKYKLRGFISIIIKILPTIPIIILNLKARRNFS